MSFEVKEELRKAGMAAGGQTRNNNELNNNIMYIQKTAEDIYYNIFIKRTSAALCGCVSLGNGLPGTLEESAAYGAVYKNQFYVTGGEQLELTSLECDMLLPGKNQLEDKVIYACQLGVTDMMVVEVLPNQPGLYISIFHVIMALLGIIFLYLSKKTFDFVSNQLSVPLEEMTDALSQIQAGVWEVSFSVPNRIEEIENVRDTVQVMLGEIEQYKISAYEEQLEKQKTQLQYLQLQLAPHFYTNCLKNAYYMLMLKEYENVERFLLCLSTHLRYLLQRDAELVTVQTERDFVLNYINLQKQMTEKPLVCDILVDEEALQVDVPILILQTFVENSVKYAREAGQMELKIQIRVRYRRDSKGDYLDISIRDNGHGYPDEILNVLNQEEISQEQRFGVGVINLQSRMHLHYGKQAGWYFSNNEGACSDLIVPVNGGKQDECTVDR